MGADGQVAGRLLVEIEASATGFARDLRRKVDEAAKGVAAQIGVDIDQAGFRQKLKTAVEAAAAGVAAKIRLDIDRDHLRATIAGAMEDATGRSKATVSAGVDKDRITRELRQVLAEASNNPASSLRIPADIDQGRLLDTVRRRLTEAEQDVKRRGGFNIPFKLPTSALMMGGLLSLVQPVVGALGQWAAGATSMVGAMAPMVNTLGAIPGLVSGAAAAFIGTKVVFSGVGNAIKLYAQQQQALSSGTKLTTAQQNKLNAALKGLSPSARDSITAVFGLQSAWKKVKLDAQERFFSKISKQITPLGKTLLPLFSKQVNGVADAVGSMAKRGASWMQTSIFRKDFGTIANTNTAFVGSMTHALGSLGHATEDWLVASAPFTQRMGKAAERGAEWVKVQVAAGRESGKLNRALNDGAGVADQMGRSIKFLSVGLYGVFKAGRSSGQNLLNGLEGTMFRFDKWANSTVGKNKIAAYFKQAEPAFHEFNKLIGDVVRGLGRMAGDGSLAGFINQVRTQLVPGIGQLLNGLGQGLGSHVITLLANLAQIIGTLAQGAGALAPVLGVFTGLAGGLSLLLKNVPGLSTALGVLLVALLALKASRTIGGVFTGLMGPINRFRTAMTQAGTAIAESSRLQGLAARDVAGAQMLAAQRQMRAQQATTRASQATRMALTHQQQAIRAELAATGASEGSGLRAAATAARQRARYSADYARALRQEAREAQTTATTSAAAAQRMQTVHARSVTGMNQATQATGRWGTAMQQLTTRFPGLATGISRVQNSFRGADGQASTFATRMSGVARVAGVGLKGALGSLTNFLGGPWGIAMIAAGVGLNMLADRQRKAAQAAQEHTARVENLSQALIASKGLIDANVRAQALQELQNKKIGTGTDNLVTVMKRAGVGAKDLVDAYTGQGESLDTLETKLKAVVKANTFSQYNSMTGTTLTFAAPIAKDAQAALDALGPMKGELKDSMAAYKDYASAVNGSTVSLSTYDKLRSAAENLALANGDAGTSVDALRKALDLLGGGTADYESANATLQQTIQGINDGLTDQRKAADALGTALIDKTTGGFKQSTKAGLQLYQQFTQLATEGATLGQVAFDNAKGHMSLTDAIKVAEKAMQPSYDMAKKLGKEYNLNADQVQALASKYGLIPSEVVTVLKSPGLDDTTLGLMMVKSQLDAFPKSKQVTVRVESLTDAAKKKLDDFGLAYKYIPATKSYEITVKDATARAKLTGFLEAQNQVKSKSITLGVKDAKGHAQLDAFQKKVANSKGKTVIMDALTKGAQKTLEALGFKVTHMKDGKVKVTLPTSNVKAAAATIQAYLDGLHDKTITLTTVKNIKTYSQAIELSKQQAKAQANGSVLSFFANGGFSNAVKAFANGAEKHVAQIAPAGSWRVWAEPETGGEAYIPLSQAKRGRSEQILEAVAGMFGGRVVYNAAGSISAADLYRAAATSKTTGGTAARGNTATSLVGGDLIITRGETESSGDALRSTMFELRRLRLGGVHGS